MMSNTPIQDQKCAITETSRQKGFSVLGFLLAFDKYIILALFVGVSALLTERFFTTVNLDNILRQNSAVGIVALGELIVILTGGIDLSVGALAQMCGITVAYFLKTGYSWPLACLFTVFVGGLAGLFTGLLVTKARITPFIATLGGMVIFNGVGLLISRGRQVFFQNPEFLLLGNFKVGPVPLMALTWFFLGLLVYIFLDWTVPGRYLRGLGGNKEAVRLAGVSTALHEMFAYVLSGLLCSMAGIMMTSRLTLGTNAVGQGWELTAIAAVMIGGGSFIGGIGGVGGAIVGVIILGLIGNIMNLLGVSIFWQQIVRGAIILLAVFSSSRRSTQ